MRNQIKKLARTLLPGAWREFLGNLAGRFDAIVFRHMEGMLFDLGGGIFRADGCCFIIPREITSLSYRAVFLYPDYPYELEERTMVNELVHAEDTVLELGGCIGVVSCITNKLLKDKTRHVVVEANPRCIPALHRNRELNLAGFLVENCAVTTGEKDVTFFLHSNMLSGGMVPGEKTFPARVPGKSLVELDSRYGPFSTLIMDIEGKELDVLTNSNEALRHYRLVIMELHPAAIGVTGVERCRTILTEAGFTLKRQMADVEAWQRN
jgi:FkbM family methyltransferase